MNHNATPSPMGSTDKEIDSNHHIEAVRTVSRVPGNDHYYEKDGLRTYGDGEDHDHEPSMTFSRMMSLVAMAFLWTGSQIPVYLFGQSHLSNESRTLLTVHRWCPAIYLRRPGRSRSLGMVCVGKSASSCCCVPLCWCSV